MIQAVLEDDFSLMAAEPGLQMQSRIFPIRCRRGGFSTSLKKHGLRVWSGYRQHSNAGFLIDRKGAPDVRKLVRSKSAFLCRNIRPLVMRFGYETAAPVVRWWVADERELSREPILGGESMKTRNASSLT